MGGCGIPWPYCRWEEGLEDDPEDGPGGGLEDGPEGGLEDGPEGGLEDGPGGGLEGGPARGSECSGSLGYALVETAKSIRSNRNCFKRKLTV